MRHPARATQRDEAVEGARISELDLRALEERALGPWLEARVEDARDRGLRDPVVLGERALTLSPRGIRGVAPAGACGRERPGDLRDRPLRERLACADERRASRGGLAVHAPPSHRSAASEQPRASAPGSLPRSSNAPASIHAPRSLV